jgi:GNAT superfamily N-acetyltransferase
MSSAPSPALNASPAGELALGSGVTLRVGYEPGAIGRIGELHGRYYAEVWKSGAAFEILMLRELCEFVERYDKNRDLLITAHRAGELIGSAVVIGGAMKPSRAQLRFVIVSPRHHGIGAGRALVQRALSWCRARGFTSVFLWTVAGLPASGHCMSQWDSASWSGCTTRVTLCLVRT